MKVAGKNYRTIWIKEDNDKIISIIDQRYLPHQFIIKDLHTVNDVFLAIKDMHVRGAGLIGATAGFGMYLATMEAASKNSFHNHLCDLASILKASRPTAVNLEWAVNRQLDAITKGTSTNEKINIAKKTAIEIANEDANSCKQIGMHGVKLIEEIVSKKKDKPVNI